MDTYVVRNSFDIDIIDNGGKCKIFQGKFLQPGFVQYNFGLCLLEKENADKFVYKFVGCPLVVDHQDVTDGNVSDVGVGNITRVWYNDLDGWYWCEGAITDSNAVDLIKRDGYSISCQYEITEWSPSDRLHNGVKFDKYILDGAPEHLAIVKNPRYEGAMIAVNKKDEDGHWVTIDGEHVLIKDKKSSAAKDKGKGAQKSVDKLSKQEAVKLYDKIKDDGILRGLFSEEDIKKGLEGARPGNYMSDEIVDKANKFALKLGVAEQMDCLAQFYQEVEDEYFKNKLTTKSFKDIFEKHNPHSMRTTGQLKKLADDLENGSSKGDVIFTIPMSGTAQEIKKLDDNKWLYTYGKDDYKDIYQQKEVSTYDVADMLANHEDSRGNRYFEKSSVGRSSEFEDKKNSDANISTFKEESQDVSRGEAEALYNYFSAENININNMLRGRGKDGWSEGYQKRLDNIVKNIDSSMKRVPNGLKLYRRVERKDLKQLFGVEDLTENMVGKSIEQKGYTSTTDNKQSTIFSIYGDDSKYITMEIDPVDLKGISLVDAIVPDEYDEDDDVEYRDIANEQEVLLQRGTILTVEKVILKGGNQTIKCKMRAKETAANAIKLIDKNRNSASNSEEQEMSLKDELSRFVANNSVGLKDVLKRFIANNKKDEDGRWVTIKGTHVFIPDGKSVDDVVKEKGWSQKGESKKQSGAKKDKTRWVKVGRTYMPIDKDEFTEGYMADEEKSKTKKTGDKRPGKDKVSDKHAELKKKILDNMGNYKMDANEIASNLRMSLKKVLPRLWEMGWSGELQYDAKRDLYSKPSKESKSDDDLQGKYERDDVEFDEEQVKKDVKRAKELGYSGVDEVSEFLGLDPDEYMEITGESYEKE